MRRHSVAEVMTTDVVTVQEQTGYKAIVETMAVLGVSAVPVVDDQDTVVGIVSEADLLLKVEYSGTGAAAVGAAPAPGPHGSAEGERRHGPRHHDRARDRD